MEEKKLRSGFTTGTCAAAAAKAAAAMLFTGKLLSHMEIITPKGTEVDLPLFHIVMEDKKVSCAVKKDAGDDPDVTNQAMIYASVEYIEDGRMEEEKERFYRMEDTKRGQGALYLTGGMGVGLVTKQGLSCPVGKPAINPVPRQMIFQGVSEARQEAGFDDPLFIRIWIPDGERLAEKTFNPKLGIMGGLSILGTSGVVEPMSEAALTATIHLEIHMRAVEGQKTIILTPGNYGETFLKETLLLSLDYGVRCSNFIEDAVKSARTEGMEEILFVGHIGKLIKVAGGVGNTHSKYGDRRMEVLWSCTEGQTKDWNNERKEELRCSILQSNTTEEAIGFLESSGVLEAAMQEVGRRIQAQIKIWFPGIHRSEVVTFSLGYGILFKSGGADDMIKRLRCMENDRGQENRT